MRVAVTRPRHRAHAACSELRGAGFAPVIRSLIRVLPLDDTLSPMLCAAAADAAAGVDPWLLLTSVEALRVLDDARRAMAMEWPRLRVACVGPVTAAAAARAGLDVTLVPSRWDGASLADALEGYAGVMDGRFYWPRAEAANPALKETLTARGATVLDAVAYRTVRDAGGMARLQRDLRRGILDAVLLFSPSAADAYAELDVREAGEVVVGVMGGSTAARAREKGIVVHVEARSHSIRSLAEQLRIHADRGSIETGGQ